MSGKIEKLRLLNVAMRDEIIEKVVRKTYFERLEEVKKQFQQFAKDMTNKSHPGFYKGLGDPEIAPYISKATKDFTYRIGKEGDVEELECPSITFKKTVGQPISVRISTHYRGNITCEGPVDDGWSRRLMPATLNANEKRRLDAIERRLKEIETSLPKFVSNLTSIIYAAKSLREFYETIPEMREVVGISDVVDNAPSSGAIVPVSDVLLSELAAAGLSQRKAANDSEGEANNVIAL